MVEELQLSNQDVTTIADMIDAQIIALVPDWKPGASFEDVTPDTGYSDQDCLPDLSCNRSEQEIGVDETSVDDSCMGNTLITQDIYSPVFSPSTNDDSPARGEGMMYGRFEEVTYNQGSDYSPSSSGAPPLLSSISFDHQAYEDLLYNVADRTSPEVHPAGRDTGGTVHESTPMDEGGGAPGEIGCMAFNDLVECQRNAGCSKYTHQTWEMIMNMAASTAGQDAYAEVEMHVLDKGLHSPLPWASGGSAAITPTDLTDGEEELDQELKILAFEQEQELIELRRKHENAISEARTRWEKKSGTTVSSKLVQDGLSMSDMMLCSTVLNAHLSKDWPSSGSANQVSAHGSLSPSVDWEAQLATVRESSTSRKSVDSDRLSLEELSALTSQTFMDNAGKPSTPSCSSVLEVVKNEDSMPIQMESAVLEPTTASKDTFHDGRNHVVDDGDERVCGHRKVCLEDVMMECVAKSPPPFDESLTDKTGSIETISPETHKLVLEVHSLLDSTTAGNKQVVRNKPCLCDPKEICLEEELGSRHVVRDPTVALGEVKLPDLVSSNPEVFSTDAQLMRDMQGSYLEPCENTGEKIVFSEVHTYVPEGNQPQGSAGLTSDTTDRGTVPTVCKTESSSLSSTKEYTEQLVRGRQGFCADAHSNTKKLQELEVLNLKCDFEKLVAVQPKNSRTSEKTDQSLQQRYGHCINSSGVGSIYKDKCSDKAAYERQELSSRTPSCQSGDGSLESKKEQLQRSIAKLEAKTLEGLQNGLVANLGTKKSFSGPLVQPTGGTSVTSQSWSNSASESSKH